VHLEYRGTHTNAREFWCRYRASFFDSI
jgi:hypothetical protein